MLVRENREVDVELDDEIDWGGVVRGWDRSLHFGNTW